MPPPYASPAVMKGVLRTNSNTLALFEQGSAIVGFHAALFLSKQGLGRLLTAQLNTLQPEPSSLVSAQTRPAAVYVWMVIAPGRAVEGMLHMAETLRKPLYAGADLYAKPATTEGRQLMLSLGYEPVPRSSTNLYRYVRLQNRSAELCSV